MTKPRVTVIITTYRRPTLLVEAIESVLAQSYPDIELIVADDGAHDETARRVATYGEAVRYLPLEHGGLAEPARNRAARVARGDFLAFLDDDDLWRDDKLARQMSLFAQDGRLGFVYTDCCFLNQNSSRSPPILPPEHKDSQKVFENLLQGCFIHPSTVVIRRSLFEEVGPFPETYQGDYYVWMYAAQTAPAACIPEPLVALRHYEGSITQEKSHLMFTGAIYALERIRQELPLTLRQRWISRRTLSRWYAHVGAQEAASGADRRSLLHSLRLNPLQRRAWQALWHLYRPADTE